MRRLDNDIWLGLFLAALSAFALWRVIPAEVVVPAGIAVEALRPNFWPVILCTALLVLSLCLAAAPLLRKEPVRPRAGTGGVAVFLGPLCVIGVMFAYYLVVAASGMLLPSAATLAVLAWLFGERRLSRIVPLALALPVALHLFFVKIANVPMPICDMLAPFLG